LADGITNRMVVDRSGEEADDPLVTPERGEVLEGEIHRPGHVTGVAQRAQLVDLSLAAAHDRSVTDRADLALGSG
jgi:hypothetical protein